MSTVNRVARTSGFTTIPDAALRDSRLSFRARGILALVLSHSDGWTGGADWFADHGTEGREAVATAMRELEEAGYRRVTRTQDDRGRWSTVIDWFDTPNGEPTPGNPYAGSPGDKTVGNHEGTKTSDAATEPETLTLIAPTEPADDGFAAFWAAYPSHRRGGRPPAHNAWKRVVGTGVRPEALMQALALFIRSEQWRKDGGRFIPHASTWLNQERFTDAPRPTARKPFADAL